MKKYVWLLIEYWNAGDCTEAIAAYSSEAAANHALEVKRETVTRYDLGYYIERMEVQ